MRPGEVEPIPKTTRPWSCKGSDPECTRARPCRACLGRRSRRSGMAKQAQARRTLEKAAGVSAARWRGHLSNEESWAGLPVRVEVKSGAQCRPAITRYVKDEAQSQATRPIGDLRPFVHIIMDGGVNIVQMRLELFGAVCNAMTGME